jgi:hypothetical protein
VNEKKKRRGQKDGLDGGKNDNNVVIVVCFDEDLIANKGNADTRVKLSGNFRRLAPKLRENPEQEGSEINRTGNEDVLAQKDRKVSGECRGELRAGIKRKKEIKKKKKRRRKAKCSEEQQTRRGKPRNEKFRQQNKHLKKQLYNNLVIT